MDIKLQKKLISKAKRFDTFKLNTQVDLFIDLTAMHTEIKTELYNTKEMLDHINFKLTKVFEKNGTSGIRQKKRLIYLHNQIWAGRQDGVEVVDAVAGLKKARLGKKYVKESVDMDRLHTLFRTLAKESPDGKPEVPDNLKDFFKATEKFSIKSKKA